MAMHQTAATHSSMRTCVTSTRVGRTKSHAISAVSLCNKAPASIQMRTSRHVASPMVQPRSAVQNRRIAGRACRVRVNASSAGAKGQKKVKLGVVGGSNLTDSRLFSHLNKKLVETKYGDVTIYDCDDDADEQICFVRRHYTSKDESYVPPHLVNSRGMMRAFDQLGVDRILLVCSVGSLQKGTIPPHSIVMPNDYIAFWNTATFAENDKIGELVPSFDLDGRTAGLNALKEKGYDKKMNLVTDDTVYVQCRGPRFEAKAESRALAMLGGDVAGMTGVSEVVLANELRIPVAMLGFCDNYCNGIDNDAVTDAYTQFYANVQAQMDTVEGAVETVMKSLLTTDGAGLNGYKPETLMSR